MLRAVCCNLSLRLPAFARSISLHEAPASLNSLAVDLRNSTHFDGGFTEPSVRTELPGPRTLALQSRNRRIHNSSAVVLYCNFSESKGNYMVDADNNVLLDCFQQISSLPLGYNHNDLMKVCKEKDFISKLMNRPAQFIFPSEDYPSLLEDILLSVSPKGLRNVITMGCGSCSNENAFKAAFMARQREARGEMPLLTEENIASCLNNEPPGSPELSVLSFNGGFHGRTIGCLSVTHSKAVHKIDIPAFDWPFADFPQLKYPLDEFVRENAAEERRCLEQVEDRIVQWKNKAPVAAMIIEPIQAEGGDRHASDNFFRSLRSIAKRNGVTFISDEVQTGMCVTGEFWAHDHWELDDAPDIVTFAKRMMSGGFYFKNSFTWDEPYRICNTWMGDPSKIMLLGATLDVIERDGLRSNVQRTGNDILRGLLDLESKHNGFVRNSRGRGFICAFDFPSTHMRDKVSRAMLRRGVIVGSCGDRSIRIRPSMLFTKNHAAIFLDLLNHAVLDVKNNI